jgi:hypothetical protein
MCCSPPVSSIQDVSAFLVRNVAEIVERNGPDVLEWPREQLIIQTSIRPLRLGCDGGKIHSGSGRCHRVAKSVFEELSSRGMGDISCTAQSCG